MYFFPILIHFVLMISFFPIMFIFEHELHRHISAHSFIVHTFKPRIILTPRSAASASMLCRSCWKILSCATRWASCDSCEVDTVDWKYLKVFESIWKLTFESFEVRKILKFGMLSDSVFWPNNFCLWHGRVLQQFLETRTKKSLVPRLGSKDLPKILPVQRRNEQFEKVLNC